MHNREDEELSNNGPLQDSITKRLPEVSRLFRGTGLILGGQVFESAFGFLKNILLARVFGASGFGLFNLGITFYSVGVSFTGMGFSNALTKFLPMHKAHGEDEKITATLRHTVYWVILTGAMIGAVIFLFAGTISTRYKAPDLKPLLLTLAVGVPVSALFKIYLTFTRSLHSMRASVLVQNISVPLVFVGVFGVLYILGFGIYSAVVAMVAADALGSLLCIKYMLRLHPGMNSPTRPEDFDKKRFIGYSNTVFSTRITSSVISYFDVIILGAYVSLADIGVYSVAIKVVSILAVVMTAMNMVFPQMVAEQYEKGNLEKVKEMYKLITRWLIYICLFISLFISVFSHELLGLFGKQYSSGSVLVLVLITGYFVSYTMGHAESLLLMMEKQKIYAINQFSVAAVNIVLNLALIPSFGILGAAITKCVGSTLNIVMCVVELFVIHGVLPFDRSCLTPFFIGAAAFIPAFIINSAFHLYWVAAAVSVLAYAALMYFWGGNDEDRQFLADMKQSFVLRFSVKGSTAQ